MSGNDLRAKKTCDASPRSIGVRSSAQATSIGSGCDMVRMA